MLTKWGLHEVKSEFELSGSIEPCVNVLSLTLKFQIGLLSFLLEGLDPIHQCCLTLSWTLLQSRCSQPLVCSLIRYSSVPCGFFFLHLITGRLLACLIALASLGMRTEKAADHLNCSGGLCQGWSASPPWYDQTRLQHGQNKGIVLAGHPVPAPVQLSFLVLAHREVQLIVWWGSALCPLCVVGEKLGRVLLFPPWLQGRHHFYKLSHHKPFFRDSKCSLKPSSNSEFGMTFLICVPRDFSSTLVGLVCPCGSL